MALHLKKIMENKTTDSKNKISDQEKKISEAEKVKKYFQLKIWFPSWKQKIITAIKLYGPGFLLYAVLVNLLDDVVLPGIFALLGYPLVGGMLFIGDFDWLTYPLYFIFAAKKQL